jgi:putative ABC transport system permease protein
MMLGHILKLASRDLRRNIARSLLAGFPIALGGAVIVINGGFFSGMERQLVDHLLIGQTGHLQVRATSAEPVGEFGSAGTIDNPEEVAAVVQRVLPAARIGSAFSSLGMVLGEETGSSRVVLVGTDAEEPGSGAIRLGRRLAEQIEADEGSIVTVTLPNDAGDLNSADLEVAEVLEAGAPWQDYFAYLALADVQELAESGGAVQEIRLHLNDGTYDLEQEATALEDLFAREGLDLDVLTYRESGRFFMGVISTARIQMTVMSLVLLVAVGLTVAGAQLLIVNERRRDVGTMMALGMPRTLVAAVFLVEAVFASVVFGILGAAVGFAVTGLLAQSGLPLPSEGFRWMVGGARIIPVPTLGAIGNTLAGLAAAAAVGGLYPALRASLLDPVRTLSETPQ